MMPRSLSQTGPEKRRFSWPKGTPQIIALLLVLLVDSLVAPHFYQVVLQDGRLFGSPIDILNRAAPVALLAIGMTLVTRAAIHLGLCPEATLPKLVNLLREYGLPTETDYPAADLLAKMLSDKKRAGDTISLVVPTGWGKSQLSPVPVSQLPVWLARGLGK